MRRAKTTHSNYMDDSVGIVRTWYHKVEADTPVRCNGMQESTTSRAVLITFVDLVSFWLWCQKLCLASRAFTFERFIRFHAVSSFSSLWWFGGFDPVLCRTPKGTY
ncbi:hypothetical protein DRR49_25095 [Escherichia coli]|nr:hypothetical protein [Escherichia coli]